MANQPHDQASNVGVEEGEVHIDGPDGVVLALTPRVALETSDGLAEGAATAADQRAMKSEQHVAQSD